jgi:hypothetical protein
MARTTQEIYNGMIAEKANRSELDSLNSSSNIAFYKGVFWVVAFAIHLLEVLFDSLRTEVNEIIDQARIGTPDWYIGLALEFQIGYDLVATENNILQYPIIDEDAQIISRAAFKEDGGELTLKLAKGEVGALEALTPEELGQFSNYIEREKLAGTTVNSISLDADSLEIDVEIFYDGIFSQAVMNQRVTDAITAYQLSFPFDGLIYRSQLINLLLDVEGVEDVVISRLEAIQGETTTPIVRVYETEAGYFAFDEGNSTITLTVS